MEIIKQVFKTCTLWFDQPTVDNLIKPDLKLQPQPVLL